MADQQQQAPLPGGDAVRALWNGATVGDDDKRLLWSLLTSYADTKTACAAAEARRENVEAQVAYYAALQTQLNRLRDVGKPLRAAHKEVKQRTMALMENNEVDAVTLNGIEYRFTQKETPVKPKLDEQVERAGYLLGEKSVSKTRKILKRINEPTEVKLTSRIACKRVSSETTTVVLPKSRIKPEGGKRRKKAAQPSREELTLEDIDDEEI